MSELDPKAISVKESVIWATGWRRWTALLVLVAILGYGAGVGTSSLIRPGARVAPLIRALALGAAAKSGGDLFVVDAIAGSAIKSGADSWRLQLRGATVLWFKDRPQRGSGAEAIGSFMSTWASRFLGSPPYGAVLAPGGPNGHHPTAVALTDPAFNQQTGIASFTLTPDKGESEADASWLSKLTPNSASKNGRLVLFIDNAGGSPYVIPPGCTLAAGGFCEHADLRGPPDCMVHKPYPNCNFADMPPHWNFMTLDWTGINLAFSQLDGETYSLTKFDHGMLSQVMARDTVFIQSSFVGADLSGANFDRSIMEHADLTGASLIGTSLVSADLQDINLSGADLRGANLSNADLTGATITKANFEGVRFCNTTMPDGTTHMDLSTIIGNIIGC